MTGADLDDLPPWEAALLDRQAVRIAAERRVLEAARAWRAMRAGTPTRPKPESAALIAAVDALAGVEAGRVGEQQQAGNGNENV